MPSPSHHPHDPLHGITLETILKELQARYGWNEMARRIPVRCFMFDPTIKSSLKFLRQTPWARQRIEDWFIDDKRSREKPLPEISVKNISAGSVSTAESILQRVKARKE